MAERSDRRDDELERALRALGPRLAYPPTPDLAAAVRARLAAGRAPRRPNPFAWFGAPFARRLALALVALVVLAGAALALSPTAREAIAGRLGVPGITIVYATPTPSPPPAETPTAPPATPAVSPTAGASVSPAATPPTPTPRPTATRPPTPTPVPTPVPIDEHLWFGRPVTLAEAQSLVAFPVLVPSLPDLGEPDAIYYGEPPLGGQISLVWLPRGTPPATPASGVGLLVTQFRATVDPGYLKQLFGGGTTVQFLTVNGQQGIWLEGDPHEIRYSNAQGAFAERTRLAGNVLIWERGGITYRIEGARTLAEALRIAAAFR